jgi:hypothetical protein
VDGWNRGVQDQKIIFCALLEPRLFPMHEKGKLILEGSKAFMDIKFSSFKSNIIYMVS